MVAMATHPDHRGKGIARELVKQAFIVAKKAECNGIKVLATSDYTRKIFQKMGFETIGTKIWKDCEHLPNKVDSFGATGHFIRIWLFILC